MDMYYYSEIHFNNLAYFLYDENYEREYTSKDISKNIRY